MNETGLTKDQKDAVNMLFEAAKLMIPVVTGFLVLFAGILGQLWDKPRIALGQHSMLAAAPVVLGVVSLAAWSGTVPCCITAIQFNSLSRLFLGQLCARTAHILFFCAVAVAMYFCLQLVRS